LLHRCLFGWKSLSICCLISFLLFSCTGEPQPDSNVADVSLGDSCQTLFGLPTDSTGLDKSQCAPTCACSGQVWTPPTYDSEWIADVRRWNLTNPPTLLTSDPYEKPAPTISKGSVCGFLPDPEKENHYSLQTYDSKDLAEKAGARVTHFGPCGLCSSLMDLSVYMEKPDLTGPVRQCALKGLGGDDEAALKCLEDIGFTKPCAQIWFYNTTHTRKECLSECVSRLNAPHHEKDGSLNACIQCDEDKSGPVFKAISGRTRRNSGLASALCRPCATVKPVTHRYRALSGQAP